MPKIQTVLDFECFEEFSFKRFATIEESLLTGSEDLSKPISGKYTSSQVIDLLEGFTDLKDLIVYAYSENGKDDPVNVTFDITDVQGTSQSTQFNSPYLVLLGMSSADFGVLNVTTSNATANDPIYLKIFRLGE